MSAWKMRLGDPLHFALELELLGEGVPGKHPEPELSESWGSFQLWVDGINLCSHYEMGERLEAVHWYQLPFIEWWVDCWDPIFHEERLPHSRRAAGSSAWTALAQSATPPLNLLEDEEDDWLDSWQAWWRRHNIQAAREGGLFPGVIFRRWRHQVEISWGEGGVVAAPEHFRFASSSGHYRTEPERVAEPLHELLGHAIDHLRGKSPGSERLDALAERHEGLRRASLDGRLGWMAGLGGKEWRRFKDEIGRRINGSRTMLDVLFPSSREEVSELVVVGSCQAPLMFGCLSPQVDERDLLTLAELQVRAFEQDRDLVEIDRLADSVPVDKEPWTQGYELAEAVDRELVGEDHLGYPTDLVALCRRLGIEVEHIELSDSEIRGVAFAGAHQRPTIGVNDRHPANQHLFGLRFTLAHEICHLLFDRDRARALALASGPWTSPDIERRANAFAAMLLVPIDAIREWQGRRGELSTTDDVRRLGQHLQVGFQTVLEHLTNLDFLSPTERDEIDAHLSEIDLRKEPGLPE